MVARYKALQCERCGNKYHKATKCSGLTRYNADVVTKEDRRWTCRRCCGGGTDGNQAVAAPAAAVQEENNEGGNLIIAATVASGAGPAKRSPISNTNARDSQGGRSKTSTLSV